MFVLFYPIILRMCFSMCLVLSIYMFHIKMQLMQRLDEWNEYVCMYVAIHTCPRAVFSCVSRPPNTAVLSSARMTCCANRHIAHYCIVVPNYYYCILTPMVSQISFDYFTTNFKSSAFSRKCFRLNLHR